MVQCNRWTKKYRGLDKRLILGSLAAVPAHAQSKQAEMAIHQEIDFKTAPARIYATLLDAKQFSAFTKDAAEIEPQPGAAFKLFGGRIEGRNVELSPNQRIVQAWRPASWPRNQRSRRLCDLGWLHAHPEPESFWITPGFPRTNGKV